MKKMKAENLTAIFKKDLFIYLREREKEREKQERAHAWAGRRDRGAEGEADNPLHPPLSKVPNAGLYPRTLDYDLGWKQTLNWLSHPEALSLYFCRRIKVLESFQFALKK